MPITRDGKCVFVHIPKTGGTSIDMAMGISTEGEANSKPNEVVMSGVYDERSLRSLQHLHAHEIRDRIGRERFADSFVFAFVRNPWDRMVSEYRWRVMNRYPTCRTESFAEFLRAIASGKRPAPSDHFDSQVDMISDPITGERLVEVVGRFERIQQDWEELIYPNITCEADRVLKVTQSSERERDYRLYYDQETVEIVRRMYAKDVEAFDYQF